MEVYRCWTCTFPLYGTGKVIGHMLMTGGVRFREARHRTSMAEMGAKRTSGTANPNVRFPPMTAI